MEFRRISCFYALLVLTMILTLTNVSLVLLLFADVTSISIPPLREHISEEQREGARTSKALQ